jgi:hypothetical protein
VSEFNYKNYLKNNPLLNEAEESAYDAGRLEKKVKAILKKEGGAVGVKPLVDAAKELGASKKDLMDVLKRMKSVKTHKDGDIIDTDGLKENESVDEILGFSEREKEIKSMKQDFDKSREEIKKSNIQKVFINLTSYMKAGEDYVEALEKANMRIPQARNILVDIFKKEMPTYYKVLTGSKYEEFMTSFFNFSDQNYNFDLVDAIVKDGDNIYKGVTINLPYIIKSYMSGQIDKDHFDKNNLKGIDEAEEKLMRIRGRKFLDIT